MGLDTAWYMWATKNEEFFVEKISSEISRFYPNTNIYVLHDDLFSPNLVSDLPINTKLIYSDFRKNLDVGEKFLFERYKALLDKSTEDLFIKVDPDSMINRAIDYLPKAEWFGQFCIYPGILATVGCGMGIRRRVLENFLELQPEGTKYFYRRGLNEVRFCEDFTLAHYLNLRLKLKPTYWDEVKLSSSFYKELLSDKWAITHPRPPVQIINRASFKVT